jgi:hypothetical protein
VGLSGAAPSGGATVTLSSNSGSLTVPASVPIGAGATTANFNATALTVIINTAAVVTASYNGASKTVTETLVAPVALAALSCNPAVLNAKATSTCTASLNNPALTAMTVTLTSNNSAVTVPGSVTVSVGATTATFTATAGTPANQQTVTITGTAAGASATATLTVLPGGINYVQSVSYTNDNAATSVAVTLGKTSAAGNTLIAALSWGDQDLSAISATDNVGNSYKVATHAFDSGQNQGLTILYAINAKGGASTITVSLGASVAYRRLIALEYSGITALDVTATYMGTANIRANNVTSTAAITTSAHELILGAVMDDTGQNNISPGTGFTQRAYANNKDLACQDMVQSSAGSVASTQTFNAAHTYLAHMAAFK